MSTPQDNIPSSLYDARGLTLERWIETKRSLADRRVTIIELAAELGISDGFLSKIHKCTREPSVDVIRRIRMATGGLVSLGSWGFRAVGRGASVARLSACDLAALSKHVRDQIPAPVPKPNQFGAVNPSLDGMTCDSAGERDRYATLKLQVRVGEIQDLETQVDIPLMGVSGPLVSDRGRPLIYRADFRYIEGGAVIIEDFKGHRTPECRLKKAILRSQGVEIRETGTK